MSIKLEHVNYIYSADTAYEKQALRYLSGDPAWTVCRNYRAYRFGKIYSDPASQWPDQSDERNGLL